MLNREFFHNVDLTKMENDILVWLCGWDEQTINNVLHQDKKFMQIQKKLDELTSEFDALGLSKEQRLLVDKLISSYNGNGAYYGSICYQQGFRDCALLLVEIGMIKGRDAV